MVFQASAKLYAMTAISSTMKQVPEIDILFLGSPGVGKATFLSRLPHVRHPSVTRREAEKQPESSDSARIVPAHNLDPPSIDFDTPPPSYTSTTSLPLQDQRRHSRPSLGTLTFDVFLFARPYRITIHPSTSQLFTDPFPTSPHFIIICFAINSKATFHNAQHYWLTQFHFHYPASSAPVMLLGLQRDRRDAGKDQDGEFVCVMPEEGLEAARAMRCDRYAECSAKTGELMWEVVEDITRAAASTTLDHDYASSMCSSM